MISVRNRLDPVEGAQERVAVRPQAANGPRGLCHCYQLLPPRLLHHHELVRQGVHMLAGVHGGVVTLAR